ncbi:MAG: cytochrome c biogenesis protein ResB [Thermomicrobiales bacterium]
MSPSPVTDTTAKNTRGAVPAFLDAIWWFFTSVRVALWLIGTTIAWVLLATLAQSTFPQYVARTIPATSGLMQRWAAWAVWESPLFLLTLGLLVVSIILGGMVNRWPGIAQRIWRPGLRTSTGFFSAVKTATTLDAPTAEEGVAAFTAVLGAHRYRTLAWRDEKSGATHLYGDKNRYSLLATFPFHTGLVLLMFGAMIAATFGWREIGFLVPDGSVRAVGHGTGLSIRNNGFVDAYYDDGRARDYYSDVTILRDGQPVNAGRLRVNSPISYGGISLHQATYGQAAKFLITDTATGVTRWDDSIPIYVSDDRRFARQFTDALGEFEPTGVQQLNDLGITVRLVASAGSRDEKIGVGQMAIAVFDNRAVRAGSAPIGTGKLDPGGAVTIGGLTFTFQREVRFTGLQITHNPGLPIIIAAATMIFLSIMVTFYLPHRRVRALVLPQADGTARMHVGAQVKLDIFGAKEFERLVTAIAARMHAASETGGAGHSLDRTLPEPEVVTLVSD